MVGNGSLTFASPSAPNLARQWLLLVDGFIGPKTRAHSEFVERLFLIMLYDCLQLDTKERKGEGRPSAEKGVATATNSARAENPTLFACAVEKATATQCQKAEPPCSICEVESRSGFVVCFLHAHLALHLSQPRPLYATYKGTE